jgi:hypothetical protein
MIINELKVIQIFCELDDFVKACEQFVKSKLIGSTSPNSVNQPGITFSEMMCIELLYHLGGYKYFQYYYQKEVRQGSLCSYFPNAPCYNRFVQLKPRILPLMIFYLNCCCLGQLCGLYYADFNQAVCLSQQMYQQQ